MPRVSGAVTTMARGCDIDSVGGFGRWLHTLGFPNRTIGAARDSSLKVGRTYFSGAKRALCDKN